jgi:hypothetical protein
MGWVTVFNCREVLVQCGVVGFSRQIRSRTLIISLHAAMAISAVGCGNCTEQSATMRPCPPDLAPRRAVWAKPCMKLRASQRKRPHVSVGIRRRAGYALTFWRRTASTRVFGEMHSNSYQCPFLFEPHNGKIDMGPPSRLEGGQSSIQEFLRLFCHDRQT